MQAINDSRACARLDWKHPVTVKRAAAHKHA